MTNPRQMGADNFAPSQFSLV